MFKAELPLTSFAPASAQSFDSHTLGSHAGSPENEKHILWSHVEILGTLCQIQG